MRNTYASFVDPEMAEKAGGALLDHGVMAEHISFVFPEGYRYSDNDWKEDREPIESRIATGITTTTPADAQAGAVKGAGIGLAAGTIAALAAILVPGVGLVVGGGALAIALGGVAGSAAAGAVAGGVTGYLKDQGVSDEDTRHYETILGRGGALITVSAGEEHIDTRTIEAVLAKYGGRVLSHLPPHTTGLYFEADPEFSEAGPEFAGHHRLGPDARL